MERVNPQARASHSASRSRYVGPSAARIAELIAPLQRVRFERGWFWTGAICHATEPEGNQLSFRQRPDGDGIDVRCKSAGCSRERVIRSLEQLTGESIWSAYTTEPRVSPSTYASAKAPADETGGAGNAHRTGGRTWRLALAPALGFLLVAPLILGAEFELAALSALGYGWIGWLGHRALVTHRRAVAAAARTRRPR
ncbi:MAG: hypothetical protein OXH38_10335 [Chloroflexi bacterium]|nr:hypothetical protein [Chloroflexota bacterium]